MTEEVRIIKQKLRTTLAQHGLSDEQPTPFLLAKVLGVRVRYFDLGSLKGFYTVLNHIPFIALNRDLPEPQAAIICAHELGHHLLHRNLAEQVFFNEFDLYRMETRTEAEANLVAAFLLIPDSFLSAMQRPENRGLSIKEAAGQLGTTEELLAIRLAAEGLPTGIRLSRLPG